MNEKLIDSPEKVITEIARILDVHKIWYWHGWSYMPMTSTQVKRCIKIIYGEIKWMNHECELTDGWISVNDRLPELIKGKQHSEKVMCIYTAENYKRETMSCVGTFALLTVDGDKKWIKVSNHLAPVRQRDIYDGYTEDVTHWMPLTLP